MNVLQWALLIVIILVALTTACHALLFKRDPRAALGWIAVSLLYPLVGPILYFLFGINRVRTRAKKLHRHWHGFFRRTSDFRRYYVNTFSQRIFRYEFPKLKDFNYIHERG